MLSESLSVQESSLQGVFLTKQEYFDLKNRFMVVFYK